MTLPTWITCAALPLSLRLYDAMLGAEDGAETPYVFPVPDEGYSALSLLHDRLYSGPLVRCLRLDLMYVPHITIGTCAGRYEAKEWRYRSRWLASCSSRWGASAEPNSAAL
jgi:hypothetical protein